VTLQLAADVIALRQEQSRAVSAAVSLQRAESNTVRPQRLGYWFHAEV
jgi:hypothetical protein